MVCLSDVICTSTQTVIILGGDRSLVNKCHWPVISLPFVETTDHKEDRSVAKNGEADMTEVTL